MSDFEKVHTKSTVCHSWCLKEEFFRISLDKRMWLCQGVMDRYFFIDQSIC